MRFENMMAQLECAVRWELLLQSTQCHGQPSMTDTRVNQELARLCLTLHTTKTFREGKQWPKCRRGRGHWPASMTNNEI